MIHLPAPRLCPCGVVHRPRQGMPAFESLLARRPYFGTVTNAWTNPSEGGPIDRDTGQTLRESDWDAVLGNLLYLGGTSGVFGSFTPTLTQGAALTLTSVVGRYFQIGKLVIATVNFTINSAGTAGNQMIIGSLPVAALTRGVPGNGIFIDASASAYSITSIWASSTSASLMATTSTAASPFGAAPAVTAAAGDQVNMTFIYEAA
jgi:hypothetical protein